MKYLKIFEEHSANWNEPNDYVIEVLNSNVGYFIASFGIYNKYKKVFFEILSNTCKTKQEAIDNYIGDQEIIDNNRFVIRDENKVLIPGNVYTNGSDEMFLYVGYVGGEYPHLINILQKQSRYQPYYYFIEWNYAGIMYLIDTGYNIHDYLIEYPKIIDDFIFGLKEKSGSIGSKSRNMIKKLEIDILTKKDDLSNASELSDIGLF
ncbi:hypothetical protein M0Q50_08660 [bacterium]|jgi:hypothetical protein|nr:hypothetical protein [bacterium]